MRDTAPEVESLYRKMLLSRSGAERLLMGFEMFRLARVLALAGLPAGDVARRREHLFLRFYGSDFSPEQRAQVLARIRAGAVGSEP